MLPSRPDEAKQVLEGALNRADEALNEGRDAIQDIRGVTATSPDLAQAMDGLMTDLKEETQPGNAGAPVTNLVVSGTPRTVQPVVRDEICRIAREALRNAFQHAKAHCVETEIEYGEALLRLRFRDDGMGIDPKIIERGGRAGHWGLIGMRERAKQMSAQLDVWSKPGAGTELELKLPAVIAYEASPKRRHFWTAAQKGGKES
jgi:signal transduction histidine kinase